MGAWGKLERFVQIFVGQDKLKLMNFKTMVTTCPNVFLWKSKRYKACDNFPMWQLPLAGRYMNMNQGNKEKWLCWHFGITIVGVNCHIDILNIFS